MRRSTLILVLALYLVAAVPLDAQTPNTQQTSTKTYSGVRPLSNALTELEQKYHRVISYEDPIIENPNDLQDVGPRVRKNVDPSQPKVPLFVPRNVTFTVDRDGSEITDRRSQREFLQLLVTKDSESDVAKFEVRDYPDRLVVVPIAVRSTSGSWLDRKPLLDTLISLPEHDRSGAEALTELREALRIATGEQFLLGGGPINALLQARVSRGYQPQPAREILIDLLGQLKGGTFSWKLLHQPKYGYFLNIYAVNVPAVGTPSTKQGNHRATGKPVQMVHEVEAPKQTR
jgi:hypothetical protein